TSTLPAPFVPLPANTSFRGVAFAPVATALAAAAPAATPEVSVFPNPATDQLTVQLGGAAGPMQVTILNMLGQAVAEQRGTGSRLTLGLTGVAPGVYVLRMQTLAGVSSCRVEVSH
ncbi:MAG: T9SS type A sorting domain-containing protein, partial [Hymenobacter sp.]